MCTFGNNLIVFFQIDHFIFLFSYFDQQASLISNFITNFSIFDEEEFMEVESKRLRTFCFLQTVGRYKYVRCPSTISFRPRVVLLF